MFTTSKKACEVLGLHPNTLRKMANNGEIKYYRTVSGQRRYNVSDEINFIRERC